MDKIAIQVTDVEKIYKLYDKPSDRLRRRWESGAENIIRSITP